MHSMLHLIAECQPKNPSCCFDKDMCIARGLCQSAGERQASPEAAAQESCTLAYGWQQAEQPDAVSVT